MLSWIGCWPRTMIPGCPCSRMSISDWPRDSGGRLPLRGPARRSRDMAWFARRIGHDCPQAHSGKPFANLSRRRSDATSSKRSGCAKENGTASRVDVSSRSGCVTPATPSTPIPGRGTRSVLAGRPIRGVTSTLPSALASHGRWRNVTPRIRSRGYSGPKRPGNGTPRDCPPQTQLARVQLTNERRPTAQRVRLAPAQRRFPHQSPSAPRHAPLRPRRRGRHSDHRLWRRGSVLAQRLARRGWDVVALDAGPFWDPDTGLGERRGGLASALLE